MAEMTEQQLGSLIDREFANAQGRPGGDISNERAQALDYYLQKPFGDEIEGESQVVTADVADVVDGMMPSLLRIFTTADNLVNFDAVGEEDVEAARQESDYVNYIFFKQNPAFLILFYWMFDALVQKNGIVKAWADETETVSQEKYKGLSEQEFRKLVMDPELEVTARAEREGFVPGPDGMLMPGIVHDVTFRRVKKYASIRVANVPPDEFRISTDANSLDPSTARFVGQERDITRSELIGMGIKKEIVDALPAVGNDATSNAEKTARNDKSDEQAPDAAGGDDKSQEKVRVREGYVKVDFDGDGRSELRFVLKAGDQVLENEICDRQPFHVISPQPMPHKHFGRSTAEKVMDLEVLSSKLVRETMNNLYHSNKPGHAVWESAIGDDTLDDLLTTRVGRIARFTRPVSEAYTTMTVPFTAGSSFSMIEYFAKAKRDRTGVSADSQGLSPEALKNIQTNVLVQALDIGRMKIEAVARIFAETGFKSLFLHIHELAQKFQNKKCVVELRNKWVEINPAAWHARKDMTVNIGLGIGTREQNLMHLEAIWGKQMALMEKGAYGTLVTPMNLFNTASEIVRNANLKNPSLYFTPSDQISIPNNEQAALVKQQQDLQARQQQLDGERQQLSAGNLQLKAREQMLEVERQRFDMRKEMEELKLEQRDLLRKERADQNDVRLRLEEIATKLTELELQYVTNVPGAKV